MRNIPDQLTLVEFRNQQFALYCPEQNLLALVSSAHPDLRRMNGVIVISDDRSIDRPLDWIPADGINTAIFWGPYSPIPKAG